MEAHQAVFSKPNSSEISKLVSSEVTGGPLEFFVVTMQYATVHVACYGGMNNQVNSIRSPKL